MSIEVRTGDVVETVDHKIVVIVGFKGRTAYPIEFKKTVDGPIYMAKEDHFKTVIGQVDGAKWAEAVVAAGAIPSMPAADMSLVRSLKVGDSIRIRHGSNSIVVATFKGYNPRRPKFPVSYEINGKPWKGKMEGLLGRAN
jgi:hypothetical protein